MQKVTDAAIALLHIGTLSETLALLNEGHLSTALWHALAASGVMLIIVIVSALTIVIANKTAKATQRKSPRKSGRRKANQPMRSRKRVSRSRGK